MSGAWGMFLCCCDVSCTSGVCRPFFALVFTDKSCCHPSACVVLPVCACALLPSCVGLIHARGYFGVVSADRSQGDVRAKLYKMREDEKRKAGQRAEQELNELAKLGSSRKK